MALGTNGTCICMGSACHHAGDHEHEEKKPVSLTTLRPSHVDCCAFVITTSESRNETSTKPHN
eukprot:1501310-Amphidinium_carterae.2